MGVDLKDIVPKREIALEDFSGKRLAVDAYNALYQFLAIIRQPTGEALTDRQGRVTSHLSGLLYRNCNLMEKGIQVAYVFDGKPPSLKMREIEKRRKIKQEATLKYREAVKTGATEDMRVYAQMTSQLNDDMVDDAKRLLNLMGIPCVQAPSEGEAQAAYLSVKGDIWATASQDYDSLLFGARRLVRNLTITGRRKLPRKNVYVEVNPEIVEFNELLTSLSITREQLVDIGILIGTDFNPDGVQGVGPKTALKLIKQWGSLERVTSEVREAASLRSIIPIREIFLNPNVTDEYTLRWQPPDIEGVVSFLCGERDFSEDRVRKALEKVVASEREATAKKTLESWF